MRKSGNICKLILMLVIISQLALTIYVFWNKKEGYMSDETWSYGLANSYYEPFFTLKKGVYSSASMLDDSINYNEWRPGNMLKDYITVQKGEQFAYGSVYYNNTYDVHPPLYYLLMHTICSFFPDNFSWWYGLSLNLLFLVGTQFFLYLTVKKITGSEWKSLLTCAFYAACKGSLLTFIFIRQYSLLVMLCTAFVFFSASYYEKVIQGQKVHVRTILACAVCACLAFLTHYHAIAFIGVFTAAHCLYMLCRKRWKEMFAYGLSIMAALGIFFLLWPAAYAHIFVYGSRDTIFYYRPTTQLRMLLADLYQYNLGFTISIFATNFWNVVIPLFIAAIVAICMLMFPFRHEVWFGELLQKGKKQLKAFGFFLKNANYIPFFALVSVVALLMLVAKTVDVYGNGHFSMRYTFVAVPVMLMVIVIVVDKVLEKLIKKKGIVIALMIGAILVATVRVYQSTNYLFPYKKYGVTSKISELTQGKNVLVVDDIIGSYPINAVFLTPYLRDTNQVCFSCGLTLKSCVEEETFQDSHVDYVFVDYNQFVLSEEESRDFVAWVSGKKPEEVRLEEMDMGKDEEIDEAEEERMDVDDEDSEKNRTSELIRHLNGGEDYKFVGAMVAQRAVYYILAFE